MPAHAERALTRHRTDLRNVLITLFESPVPDTHTVAKEVLTCVLGQPMDWSKKIIDVATNPHLSALARLGVPPIV